ncbi:hypothetical protein C8A05DRAFT_46759 [Staphylotrichum tortipilum]|uniref:Uncharacterized protein n=1 Tax=Staphylotrichum tortipilum TaxID=2831512 RepID=A0AAN6MDY9_9PEZI|nr:hypothetical protein C8A05DRAFT_46759 [Staphylotrichum longicolle]
MESPVPAPSAATAPADPVDPAMDALPSYDDATSVDEPTTTTTTVEPSSAEPAASDEPAPISDDTPATAAPSDELPWDILLHSILISLAPAHDPYYPPNADEDLVPTYTETDTSPLLTLLAAHPALAALLSLPLTAYPLPLYATWSSADARAVPSPNPLAANEDLTDDEKAALYRLQCQLISALFAAVASKNIELVTMLVRQGFVSPDVPDAGYKTPLLAAVEAGDGAMVCTLIGLGARVDGWGEAARGELRTPLMAAAAQGKLALVKLLKEDFGADDALIAPDGQMALRLAADAGWREVVDYLPARRGGAWRRWQTHHHVAVRRVRAAAKSVYTFCEIIFWHVPRFFVWSVPKHLVVRPLWKGCKFCWTNKHKFGGWCKAQAKAFPGRAQRAGKALWKAAKKVPKALWRGVKAVPRLVERLLKWVWTVIKRIPAAMKKLAGWLWDSLKRAGKAVAHVFLRAVAAIHTAVAAVLDFFRNIKPKDVWNGVCDVADAVFRGLPRVCGKILLSFLAVIAGTIIAVFGLAGKIIVFLAQALWYLALYIPRHLGEILAGIWTSIAKGYHEILVWINPKH